MSNHRLCALYAEMTCAFFHRFLSFWWFVGLLTYPFMCRGFPSHKRIASAFSQSHDSSSNDRFSPRANSFARKQSFRNTAIFRILPASIQSRIHEIAGRGRFFPCPGLSPDSLVQRTRMRVRLFGSRICHKSHAIQFFYPRA